MKKYILFQFFRYYPIGGLGDITRSFTSLKAAIKEGSRKDDTYEYNEIVDRDTWEIIWKNNKKSE